jgi:hypothetical protein
MRRRPGQRLGVALFPVGAVALVARVARLGRRRPPVAAARAPKGAAAPARVALTRRAPLAGASAGRAPPRR